MDAKTIDTIIERIKCRCAELGIKQKYFFEQIGKNRVLFNDWKNKKSAPTEHLLEKIAYVLHTTPAYLLGETDEKEKRIGISDALWESLSAEKQELISFILDLPEDDLSSWENLVEELRRASGTKE